MFHHHSQNANAQPKPHSLVGGAHQHDNHCHDHRHEHDHDHIHHHHHHHSHHHSHHHGHHHGHSHHHDIPKNYDKAFVIALALNISFVVIEFVFGVIANSTALIADAGHNLSDVLGLLLAWGAAILARKAPSSRYTYGLRSSSILAALANGILLFVVCGAMGWEAVRRFAEPPAVASLTVVLVAAVGILVNGISALLFMRGGKKDVNIRGAYLHMAADAAVSLAVVVAGVVIMFTQWYWLDPAMSLVILLVILVGTWGLLREAFHLALNAVPDHIDIEGIEQLLRNTAGVVDIHDLHIWAMSTTETALTVHLVMPDGYPGDALMDDLAKKLSEQFSIHHSTLQIEQGTTTHACALDGVH